jgi:hypothetical protein
MMHIINDEPFLYKYIFRDYVRVFFIFSSFLSRDVITHCCQMVTSVIATSATVRIIKFSLRNEMRKIFAGFPTNRTRRLKKFVVWAVNGKKLTPC